MGTTQCNYCNVSQLKARLKKEGKVGVVTKSQNIPSWQTVIVEGDEKEAEYGLYMRVPDHCCC